MGKDFHSASLFSVADSLTFDGSRRLLLSLFFLFGCVCLFFVWLVGFFDWFGLVFWLNIVSLWDS